MFLEQDQQKGNQIVGSVTQAILPASPGRENQSAGRQDCLPHDDPFRWVFLSDVCKHCEEAGCLEACPTGSIVRTEVGSVFVQNDVCNGCGYCVVSCPFGVMHESRSGWLIRSGEILSGPLALILRLVNLVPLAAISFLVGALISRFGWISAGEVCARDPEAVFASQR